MKSVFITCLLIAIIGLNGCFGPTNPQAEEKALSSAESWLEMVDGQMYGQSWDEAAGYFKSVLNKELWEQTISVVREPLGKVISRKVRSKKYMTEVPGAPDGEYVTIQYKTSFENKKSAVETVTPMLDEDGIWRVSGYYIK